jgi:hypothetical protein
MMGYTYNQELINLGKDKIMFYKTNYFLILYKAQTRNNPRNTQPDYKEQIVLLDIITPFTAKAHNKTT